MGVAYNPRVVTDGLVACYDLGNTRRSYSPNVHPGSTNIYDWYVGIRGNAQANQSTIAKDTITSPVGNTPLRMDITGNDSHIYSYSGLQWNLDEASVGETWTVSVYAKATSNINCQLFIFGINSSGSYVEAPAGTIDLTTEWQRISYTHTFQNSNTDFIQSRLDGPDSGGAGESIWFDGWQVERGTTTSNFTSDYTGGDVLDISKNSNNGTIVSSLQYNNSNGGYVTFDGSNDYIGLGVTAGELGIYDDSYTFEAWVYPTDISALSGDNFIFGTTQQSLRQGLHLGFRNTNIHQGHYSSDYVSGTVTANQWYHLAWTYDKNLGTVNGTAKIYKNGQLQGRFGTINSWIGTTEILIGNALTASGRYFQGRGAQFRIYNRALSASEVLQNFNSQKVRYGTFENEPTIVRDDLLLYYDSSNKNSYPEYGNVIYDIGSGDNTGTLQNGASYNDGGRYFSFDGVDDYISITDNLGNPQQFTVECWVYPSELDIDANNNYRRILTHSGASSNSAHSVLIEQGGNISFRIPGGSTDNFQASGFTDVNQWGHIVCTYDQTDRKIYFNGTLRGTKNEPGVTVDFGSPAIVSPNNINTFKGRIANFRIYSKALSPAEVQQNYDASKVRFIDRPSVVKDNLILYLDAEDVYSYDVGISTTTWNDIAGGRVATINNGPSFNQNYFSFNGVDQNVVFPSSVEVSTAGFTMAFLMRVPSSQVNGVNWSFMLADRDYGAGDYEIGIYSTNNTNFNFKENGSSPQSIVTQLGEEWVYLVFGMTPSLNPFIYVNGEIRVRATSTFASSILDFTHLFSRNDNSTSFFKGDFSAVQLYDRELKPSEIKQNFNVFRERFGI